MSMPVVLTLLLLLVVVGLQVVLLLRRRGPDAGLTARLDTLERGVERTERALREELAATRRELLDAAQRQRAELAAAMDASRSAAREEIRALGEGQTQHFATFLEQLERVGARVDDIRAEAAAAARQAREEQQATLRATAESLAGNVRDLGAAQGERLEQVSAQLGRLVESNEARLAGIELGLREELGRVIATVDGKLGEIRTDNEARLEQIRATVDERLQGTLEARLGESFRTVSTQLEQVHKGLGEMRTLASGVGDLKRMLTNVKTRGTFGEVQLAAILEQVLSPDQLARNVATKRGSTERVEWAIKLPGRGPISEPVLLPLDAKFPTETYQRLLDAAERADAEALETLGRQLETQALACARDISSKYLDPPGTTDFAVMFLPTEGLYAEVLRRPGLVEQLQRACHVVVAGPTTLLALLNSLQMGFRTLAIEKRSSEVWRVLGAVKTEFGKFGGVIEKVQKKLQEASNTIDDADRRRRAINRKLREVEELPADQTATILPADAEIEPETELVETS